MMHFMIVNNVWRNFYYSKYICNSKNSALHNHNYWNEPIEILKLEHRYYVDMPQSSMSQIGL